MNPNTLAGTEFEKPRGVSRVDVRRGFTQVHVTDLSTPLADSRLKVLMAITDAGVSLDFLKLTQNGVSFLVSEPSAGKAQSALAKVGVSVSMQPECGIVLIHAVNLRDEEGLVARLVSIAIREGVPVEHLSDMHDRLLLVTASAEADRLAAVYRQELMGGAA